MKLKRVFAVIALSAGLILGGTACEVPEESQSATKENQTQSKEKAPKASKGEAKSKVSSECKGMNQKTTSFCEKLIQHPWYVDNDGVHHANGKDLLELARVQHGHNTNEFKWALQAAVFDFEQAYRNQAGENFPYSK